MYHLLKCAVTRTNFRWSLFGVLCGSLLLVTGCEEPVENQGTTNQPTQNNAHSNTQPGNTPAASSTSQEAPADAVPAEAAWFPALSDEQSIADNLQAKNYYVVLDGSGSMKDSQCAGSYIDKMSAARDALLKFTTSLPKDANLGLLSFSPVQEYLSLGSIALRRSELATQIQSLSAGGRTPLGESLELASQQLRTQAAKQLGYGEYHLVVVTDGAASDADRLSKIVAEITSDTPMIIHTIGFCIRSNHTLNQPNKMVYRSASDPAALAAGLQAVLAEAETFQANAFE